jgi:hypothetical protein
MAKAKPRRLQPRTAVEGLPVTRAAVEGWEQGAPDAVPFPNLVRDQNDAYELNAHGCGRDFGPSDVLSPPGAWCYVDLFDDYGPHSLAAAEGPVGPAYSTLGKSDARARRLRGRTRRVKTHAPAEVAGGRLIPIGAGDYAALRGLPPRVRKLVEERRLALRSACETSADPGAVGDLLRHLSERGICYELCDRCLWLVTAAVQSVASWCRKPGDWEYSGANGHASGGLLEHLLHRYPVPKWLAPERFYPALLFPEICTYDWQAHLAVRAKLLAWFIHLGQGGSLRELPGLGYPLSRKAAHFAATYTAGDVGPEHVPFLGRCVAHGVDEGIGGFLARNGAEEWAPSRLGDLLDWAARERPAFHEFLHILDYLEADGRRRLGHRSLASVTRDADLWAQGLRRRAAPELTWSPCGIGPLVGYRSATGHDWDIVELCSSAVLQEETDRMHHCVASYDRRAHGRSCAIFSLRPRDGSEPGRTLSLATIEVYLSTRQIVQVRGKSNAGVDGERQACIRAWAATMQLTVSSTAF